MTLIQHIETIWTKKSRGMPVAQKRNAVPRILEIPNSNTESTGLIIHKVIADEKNDFELNHELQSFNDRNKYWSFTFENENDLLLVYFAYTYFQHGQPKRDERRFKIFTLKLNDWGSFHINGRFTSYSGQHYRQHFVNIAHIDKFNHQIFLDTKPKIFINKMENLF